MEINEIRCGGETVCAVRGDVAAVTDAQSALDLLAQTCFRYQCHTLVLSKALIAEPFFDLKTGLLGEMLQKYTNYNVRTAIVGDFSGYTSTALRDFIRESNRGSQVFFLPTEQEALEALFPAQP